jgi:hypothetical protein
MPILHFRLTHKKQTVLLSKTIHSQNFTLRRCIITKNASVTQTYKGGLIIDCAFLSGNEILSNFNSNDILIPFADAETNIDNRYTQNFAAEDISTSFIVKSYDFEKQADAIFQDDYATGGAAVDGAIKYADIFFEFDELTDYNTY